MRSLSPKKIIGAVALFAVILISVYLTFVRSNKVVLVEPMVKLPTVATTTETMVVLPRKVIGKSVLDRPIEAFTYGRGKTNLLFVGGMHGGYEWNSVVLAYQFLDYLDAHPEFVPKNVTITVIPSLNPDGVFEVVRKEGRFTTADVPKNIKVVGTGRMNAHKVDLNRNFDCKWQPKSMWKGNVVSAGTSAFSEPESQALHALVLETHPDAVIFWHSQSGSVYASQCKEGILPETLSIMNVYAKASGYSPVKSFDAYAITGDSEGWLASIGIPAITVELKTHETVEWKENLAGIKALLDHNKTI